MYQLVIVRKDLNMSIGKVAAQVSHASMAFLVNKLRQRGRRLWKYNVLPTNRPYKRADICRLAEEARQKGKDYFTVKPKDTDKPYGEMELCENEYDNYSCNITIDKETYEEWVLGSFTKIICEAKTKNKLLKAIKIAESLGLQEGVDFFLIKDNCLTELEPEETDEDGVGQTLTCIGFRPLDNEMAHKISKNYQLYK